MTWALIAIGLIAILALARWGVGALWVRMVYDRWDAMCAPKDSRRNSS